MKSRLIKMQTLLVTLMFALARPCFPTTQIDSFLTDIQLQSPFSGIFPVDCIYVLNLDYRPEKWQDVRTAFNSYGIFPNRVNAINGWLLSENEKRILMGHYPLIVGGKIGCILSHVSALQHAFNQGYEVVWICEDDIEICENPHQLSCLIAELSSIDPEWDVLYTDPDTKNKSGVTIPSLGSQFRPDSHYEDRNYYLEVEVVNHNLVRKNQRFGAYSYLLSKNGIEKILRYFKENYLWTAYDIDMHYVPGIRQYCMRRGIVSIKWELPSDTDFHYAK